MFEPEERLQCGNIYNFHGKVDWSIFLGFCDFNPISKCELSAWQNRDSPGRWLSHHAYGELVDCLVYLFVYFCRTPILIVDETIPRAENFDIYNLEKGS